MNATLRDIIDQIDSIYTKKAEITGEDPDSMPGAENDKPAPEGATKDDPKVKDDTIDNEKNRSIADAEVGSDVPVTQDLTYESDEPVLNAEKKPLDTTDANAKEASASALGTKILDKILKTKQASAEKKAEAEKKVEHGKDCKCSECMKKAAKKAPEKCAEQKQAEPSATIPLDMAMMAKIAAITLADEEGQFAVQQALAKRAGAEFAAEVFDTLEKRAAEAQAQYEFQKGAQAAEEMIGDLQEAQGAQDAEAALAGMGAGEEPPAPEQAAGGESEAVMDPQAAVEALSQYDDSEIIEACKELEDEGVLEPGTTDALVGAAAGEGGEPTAVDSDAAMEDALTEAIENGQISEEDIQALVDAAGGGETPAEGAPAEEAAPAPEPQADEEKTAAAKKDVKKASAEAVMKKVAATLKRAHARSKARAILANLRK